MLILIRSNHRRETRSFKRTHLMTTKLTKYVAFIVTSMACKIATRVSLIVAKRLAERDVFTRHDEGMISKEYKSKSHKVICVKKKTEI